MVIERDARRYVLEAIQVEREMQEMEVVLESEKVEIYQDEEYNQKRQELVTFLSKINSVTNVNGKGRDDLTDINILRAAENLNSEIKPG